jgi:alkyl hydroperoxide reductase subunit AhpC
MLTIGDKLPEFKLKACIGTEQGKEFKDISSSDYAKQWKVLFAWPLDFTSVCGTEVIEFGKAHEEFTKRNAVVLGFSIDSQYSHLAWRKENPEVKDLPYPMLSDLKRELANALGILHKEAGICYRAAFIVDPNNTIRWVSVNDLPHGRGVSEILRSLDALQTEKATPCNWQKGQNTL